MAVRSIPNRDLIPLQSFRLRNGLHVVLHHDPRLPRVTVNVLYRIGSRDDPPGRTGVAHLFEHLMFMGTRRVPENRLDLLMEEMGGANNAFTSEDVTDYYDIGPSRLLDTLLWVEADRMASLARSLTKRKLDLQREVVLNERRQHYENAPYGQAFLELPRLLYPARHPYGWPVIGAAADIRAVTVEDVKRLFAKHYAPANASLVVAGRFDPGEARELVRRRFEWIPSAAACRRRLGRSLPHHAQRRILHDRVELPRITLFWHSPRSFAPGDAELDMAAAILSVGKQSRLRRALMHDKQLAVELQVRQESRQLGSLFCVDISPREGVDLDQLEKTTLRVIARLFERGPSNAELERARNGFYTEVMTRLQQLSRRAEALNLYWSALGRPDYLEQDLARYQALTTGRLRSWAQRVLSRQPSVMRVLPGAPSSAA